MRRDISNVVSWLSCDMDHRLMEVLDGSVPPSRVVAPPDAGLDVPGGQDPSDIDVGELWILLNRHNQSLR
jgi:hypothetical protein